MRIKPLICWHCSNWFIPKISRPTKFCCGACRTAFHRKDKNSRGYDGLVNFWYNDEEEHEAILDVFREYACMDKCPADNGTKSDGSQGICVECLFENNYPQYVKLVAKYGIDEDKRYWQDWMKDRTALEEPNKLNKECLRHDLYTPPVPDHHPSPLVEFFYIPGI